MEKYTIFYKLLSDVLVVFRKYSTKERLTQDEWGTFAEEITAIEKKYKTEGDNMWHLARAILNGVQSYFLAEEGRTG